MDVANAIQIVVIFVGGGMGATMVKAFTNRTPNATRTAAKMYAIWATDYERVCRERDNLAKKLLQHLSAGCSIPDQAPDELWKDEA